MQGILLGKKNCSYYSRSRKKEKCFASRFLLFFSHDLLKAVLFLDIEAHRKMPFKTNKLKCQKGETRLLQKFDLLKLFSCAVKLNSNLRDWQGQQNPYLISDNTDLQKNDGPFHIKNAEFDSKSNNKSACPRARILTLYYKPLHI